MNAKTLLTAIVLACDGNQREAVKRIKANHLPNARFIEQAEELIAQNKVITMIDEDYPIRLTNSPLYQIVMFIVKRDEGAPTIVNGVDAYMERECSRWSDAERRAKDNTERLLQKLQNTICEVDGGYVRIRNAGDDKELVLASRPSFDDGAPSVSDMLQAYQIACGLSRDAYWFSLSKGMEKAALGFHIGIGDGDDYFLHHEEDGLCNDCLENGGKPIPNFVRNVA